MSQDQPGRGGSEAQVSPHRNARASELYRLPTSKFQGVQELGNALIDAGYRSGGRAGLELRASDARIRPSHAFLPLPAHRVQGWLPH